MTTLHIPNDTPTATQAAIDASLPGDELVFDRGVYVFHKTLVILPDRHYHIEGQTLLRGEPFEGRHLIYISKEAKETADCYYICDNLLTTESDWRSWVRSKPEELRYADVLAEAESILEEGREP